MRPRFRDMIAGAEVAVVSAVTLVEIAIKHALGPGSRDPMTLNAKAARVAFLDAGLVELPLAAAHAEALDALPPLHRDPFDRMLIAQARTEPLRLLTADRQLAAYGPDVVLV